MYKYLREMVIVGLTVLLLSVWTCSHNSQKVAQGETKQLKEQLKKSKEGLVSFREKQKAIFDSISSAEKIKDKKITELHNSNERLNQKLIDSAKELEKRKQSFRNKDFEQLATVFKEMGYENVTFTNTSVALEKESPVDVLDDLVEGVNCLTDLQTKDSIIFNKDSEIKISQEKIKNREILLSSKTEEVIKLDDIVKIQTNLSETLSKENSKLKTKNFLTTYILPPLVFIGGVYVGSKVIK